MSSVPGFVWHTRRPCKIRDEARTALVRAVVVVRHGSDDPVERGDDGDDAGRCRSDARARTRAALAAAERLRVTVDAAGADIAREREQIFREWVSNATTRIGRNRRREKKISRRFGVCVDIFGVMPPTF